MRQILLQTLHDVIILGNEFSLYVDVFGVCFRVFGMFPDDTFNQGNAKNATFKIKGYKQRKTRFLLRSACVVDQKKRVKAQSVCLLYALSCPVLRAGARGSTGQRGVEEFRQTERKV